MIVGEGDLQGIPRQIKTNLGGKLALSAALGSGAKQIEIRKAE